MCEYIIIWEVYDNFLSLKIISKLLNDITFRQAQCPWSLSLSKRFLNIYKIHPMKFIDIVQNQKNFLSCNSIEHYKHE